MKVTICSFTGYKALNGANLRAYFLAKEFLKRGFDLDFITPNKEDALSCQERFNCNSSHVSLDISRFKSSRLKLYPIFAYKAGKLIKKDIDLVFGQSLPSALAVNRAKTKAKKVVDYVDLWSEYWLYANPSIRGKLIYQVVRWAEKHSLKDISLSFTITDKLKELLQKRGCSEEKVRIVRDGVDLRMFHPFDVKDDFYEKYGLNKEDEFIAYQGGIAAHDGVQFLVDAAPLVLKEYPDIKFLIIGTGAYYSNIVRKVKCMGLEKNFIFTGWVDYEDMPSFMNIAKINSVPLPNSPATQGVVTYKLMEAMACGTPTIIGNLPGVNEAVEHKKTACLCRSEDKNRLSGSIIELLKDQNLYNDISSNGLELIKNHDWRDIAKEMVDKMVN
ncbi:glycosyltransferase family 4 protein [Candidatus Woesearchaeota archaeon]|nr:glycosyltransferase family 4 protein [Candidatus Woesearchaeota archaeon]